MKNIYLWCSLLAAFLLGFTNTYAQNTTIKPDKTCINCPTDTPEAGTTLEVKGNTKIEGKINLIAAAGDSSVFIGANTGMNDDGNNFNIFIGTNAGRNNTTGGNNTFLGYRSGYSNTTAAQNTFLGYYSGYSSTNDTRNTFIGHLADQLTPADSLDRSIAIGHRAKVGCSNCAVIGGTSVDAVNAGIGGINTPQEKLHIVGGIKFPETVSTIIYNSSTRTGIGTDGFRMKFDGSFFGGFGDALIFEKTDNGQSNPDGGMAFVNTGLNGIIDTSLVIRGSGNIGICFEALANIFVLDESKHSIFKRLQSLERTNQKK